MTLDNVLIALLKASIAIVFTMAFLFTPLDMLPLALVSSLKVVVAFMLLVYIGKLLYDTFFYNQYKP